MAIGYVMWRCHHVAMTMYVPANGNVMGVNNVTAMNDILVESGVDDVADAF